MKKLVVTVLLFGMTSGLIAQNSIEPNEPGPEPPPELPADAGADPDAFSGEEPVGEVVEPLMRGPIHEAYAEPIAETDADVSARKGQIALPTWGVILHRAGETDAAGVTRPGIVVATRPRAIVTSPTAATIRYRGPLLELGNLVILEPQPGLLFVFAGLQEVYGETGQVIPEGSPIGLMPGETPEIGAILSTSGDGTGTDRSETLYIEVRQDNSPVDPESWFRTSKDG